MCDAVTFLLYIMPSKNFSLLKLQAFVNDTVKGFIKFSVNKARHRYRCGADGVLP